jgi:hypothetical protein
MTDIRTRFERLDEIAAPNLWAEVEGRAERMAGLPIATAFKPRMTWRTQVPVPDRDGGGQRLTPVPALLILLLLLLALLVSMTIGAGWGWWNRANVLLIPRTDSVTAIQPEADCPGAISVGERGPFGGWPLGPQPGLLATAHPGRITGLWHDPSGQPRGESKVVIVEVDPATRTMCRLVIPVRTSGEGLLEGAGVPDIDWAPHGDALAYFHGDVEGNGGCCAPGQLTLWTTRGQVDLPVFLGTGFGNLDWSHDGQMLAVTTRQQITSWADPKPSTVGIYTSAGDGPRELRFDCDPCVINGSSFSPSNTRVAVTYWRVTSEDSADELIGIADTATGAGTVLDVGLTRLDIVGWQDDGTVLATDDQRRLVAIPIDRPAEFRVVANFPFQLGQAAGVWELRWSPGRSRAAYITYNTDQPDHNGQILSTDLFVFDVASGGTRLVAHEPAQVDGESLTWAPDDRTLAYRVQNDPIRTERGVTLKVADVLEGTPVAIAIGISPVAWRPIWR